MSETKTYTAQDAEFLKDASMFAVGVNTRLALASPVTPATQIFDWADSLIETRSPSKSSPIHKARNAHLQTLWDLTHQAVSNNEVLCSTLPKHIDQCPRHTISPYDLRIFLECAIVSNVIPETGGPAALNGMRLIQGFKQHVGYATHPESGSSNMMFGSWGHLMLLVFNTGELLPQTMLVLGGFQAYSRGLRRALTMLGARGTGPDARTREAINDYGISIKYADEAVLWFACFAALAILDDSAVAEVQDPKTSSGLYGPHRFHERFSRLPIDMFFSGHARPNALRRACLALTTILIQLSEQRRIGPAHSALM